MHKSDVATTLEGAWDPTTRVYKNKNMMNQEQYMADMDDFFHANNCFLGHTVEVTSPIPPGEVQKYTALANGEDDVSMLSNLTEKTLQEANKAGDGTSNENQLVQSGMTSKSKTQLAVKEALQAVSLEHNKALREQQKKFQLEIESLKKALVQSTPKTKNSVASSMTNEDSDVEISSDTNSSLTSLQQQVQNLRTNSPDAKRRRRTSNRLKRSSGDSSNNATSTHD